MLNWLNRYLPVLIAISVLLMLVQFLRQVWPSASTWAVWHAATVAGLHAARWYLLATALALGALAWAAWLHARDRAAPWIYWLFPWTSSIDSRTSKPSNKLSSSWSRRPW